jgi:CRISPR type IV-associated protein Csf2
VDAWHHHVSRIGAGANDGDLMLVAGCRQPGIPTPSVETIKGLLRNAAYVLCVDAARQHGQLKVNLQDFYNQTAGGVSFAGGDRELGSDAAIRATQPLLSLFGAANPILCGRIIVHHAISHDVIGGMPDAVLPSGARRDALISTPALADILDSDNAALWSRQNTIVSRHSEAQRRVTDAKRMLARARNTNGADLAPLEAELKDAAAAAKTLQDDPEFQHSIRRIIDPKHATPAGVVYDHAIEIVDGSPEEIGLAFAALEMWGHAPRIGGGKTAGYGEIEANYTIERLGDAPLMRDRKWTNIGTVTISRAGTEIKTTDAAVQSAMAAWRGVESDIRIKTRMFG